MSAVVAYERQRRDDQIRVVAPAGSVTHVHVPDHDAKSHLVTAILKARCEPAETLELFGAPVAELRPRERSRVRARVGAVSKVVGLVTSLNAWENISLPVAYHAPARLADLPAQVHALMEELGGTDESVLSKLPEEMTLYEKLVAAYVRALIDTPELLIVEELAAGLGPTKRKRCARFAEVYHARCPGGTYVQLEDWGASHER